MSGICRSWDGCATAATLGICTSFDHGCGAGRAPRLAVVQPACHRVSMSTEVRIGEGDGARLEAHRLRAAVLSEVHARPFTSIETPRRVLHFAFDTTAERGEADRANLSKFCAGREIPPPKAGSKHHRVALGAIVLRWEQHSEFTTYTWELPSEAGGTIPFHPAAPALARPMGLLRQPGPLLVAVDLHLVGDGPSDLARLFDPASLAVAETADGVALYATDFQADPAGFVRILVIDRGLEPARAGALTQRAGDRDLSLARAARSARGATARADRAPHRDAAGRCHRGDEAHRGV
jgi:Protein of unknown function (DUF3422)